MIDLIANLPELSSFDLYAPWMFGFPKGTVIVLAAAVFLFFRIFLGFHNGVVVEGGFLIALVLDILLLRYLAPVLEEGGLWHPGRMFSSMFWVIAFFLCYRVIWFVVKLAGQFLRALPVIGFLDGIAGALAGCVWAVLTLFVIQWITGINITGAFDVTIARAEEIAQGFLR